MVSEAGADGAGEIARVFEGKGGLLEGAHHLTEGEIGQNAAAVAGASVGGVGVDE